MDNNLRTRVSELKLIARNALRMELISPRLTKISDLEKELQATIECKENIEHLILVKEYEITKMDKEHPNYEKDKEYKEENIKYLKTEIENHEKALEEINEEIKKQNEAISKIETGETLVSLNSLNNVTRLLIEKDALNQV
jgi:predicted  nucleic acid-binding Zn-ribbon protein